MGNKPSTNSKAEIIDGQLSIFVLSCDNSSSYPTGGKQEDIVSAFSGHKLTATIQYNNLTKSVSCDYYKNAVWKQGSIQFPYSQSVNLCTISLGSPTNSKAPKYSDFTFDISQYNQGEIIKLVFNNVNSSTINDVSSETMDGATRIENTSSNTNSVVLNVLFTTNLKSLSEQENSIITKTRDGEKNYSIVLPNNYNDLDNGDIILYSGASGISEIIRDRFYRPWSHVGVIIKTYPFINHNKGGVLSEEPVLYVMESVGKEGIKDPFRKNQALTGVNIFPLKERLIEYDGYNVQALRLKQQFNERQKERFLTNCFELHGARLPFDVFQAAILLLERLKKWNWTSDKSVFCSELVTICLFRAGVLTGPENYPSNTDPGEVSEFLCFKEASEIRLLKYDI